MYEYRQLNKTAQAELVAARLAKGYPAHRPPHPITDRDYYLLTATCYEHRPHLQAEARRTQLLTLLFETFPQAGHTILAWALLPNHYHLLVKVNEFMTLSKLYKSIHGPTARAWNIADQAQGRKVWYRFSDRAIRSERHYYTTLNYIHYNPVKHDCVASPYDWPQSSVHWYLAHHGRAWLRDLWVRYPVKDYGSGWDDG